MGGMEPKVSNRLPLTILVDRVDQHTVSFVQAAIEHVAAVRLDPDTDKRVFLSTDSGMVLRGVLTELMAELGPRIMARKEAVEQNRSSDDDDLQFSIGAYFMAENIRTVIDHMLE